MSNTAAESPLDNLGRIAADTARLRRQWAEFKSRLIDPMTSFAVVAVDIDHSATVRQHGIEAKVELVSACRAVMCEIAGPHATVIDAGTRDETFFLLTGTGAKAAEALAERIRSAVHAARFPLTVSRGPVSVTVSCGVGTGRRAGLPDVIEAAQDGLTVAKRTRDAAAAGSVRREEWGVSVPAALLAAARVAGLDVVDLHDEALQDTIMAHTGIYHWLVTQGLAADRVTLDGWRAQLPVAAMDAGFVRLLEGVVLAHAVASTGRTCARVPANVPAAAHRIGDDTFMLTEGHGLPEGATPDRVVHDARYGPERVRRTIRLPASVALTLDRKVVGTSRVTRDDVATEALSLMVDAERRSPGSAP